MAIDPWDMKLKKKLLYMWQAPGMSWEDSIAIPKKRLLEYQHRAIQTPGKLWYIWAESAGHARYYLRKDPEIRKESYKRAKQAEKEMVKRVKIRPSMAEQMKLFGSPLCGQIMTCISQYPSGRCAEFQRTCDPEACISESPKKRFSEQIYKVGPPGEKYLEPLPHMYPVDLPEAMKRWKSGSRPLPTLTGDIMTCAKWKLTDDMQIRCAKFQQTCHRVLPRECVPGLSGEMWIKDLDLDKGAFTRKAKAAGFDVQQYADHVIENREDYDMRTFRQAVLARTFAKISRGEYSGVEFGAGCRDKEGKFVPVPACRGGSVKKEKPKKPKKRIVAPVAKKKKTAKAPLKAERQRDIWRMTLKDAEEVQNRLRRKAEAIIRERAKKFPEAYGPYVPKAGRTIDRETVVRFLDKKDAHAYTSLVLFAHRAAVRHALDAGKPVPQRVLLDFPDLAEFVMPPALEPVRKSDLTKVEKRILDKMAGKTLHIDEIARATGLPPYEVSSGLVMLELKNVMQQAAGKMFTPGKRPGTGIVSLSGDITHCALWAFDQVRGVYSCVAQGPACAAQKACVKPVLSPGRQSDIKRYKRVLRDSTAAVERLNIRVGELRTRANRDFHGRLARIGVYVEKGDRVDLEDPAVKKIRDDLLRGYQPKLDSFNYRLNGAQKNINKANGVLTPKPRKKRSMRACVGWKKVWSDYYNSRVDRCARYKAACEAGVCLPEPIPRPALPEPSASAVKSVAEMMAEEYQTPPEAKLIGKEIMSRSGLRNYRTRPGEKADQRYNEYVPVALRRKGGLSPDEMASEMGLDGDDELYRLIQKAYPHMHGKGGKAGAAVRKRQRELRADWHYWKDDAFEELQEELMKQL